MTDGCVQFNRHSWHFILVNLVFPHYLIDWNDKPRMVNLCPYMRHVLASVFLVAFLVPWRKLPDRVHDYTWAVQAEVIFLFLVIFTSYLIDLGDSLSSEPSIPPFLTLVFYGFIGGNVIGILGGALVFGSMLLKEAIDDRPRKEKKYKEHRTRGLIKTYMASKHDKICPCVEFVEDD